MRRPTLLALALLAALSGPAEAADARFPDAATRAAVVGCWDVEQGVTLRLSEHGKHSVWAEARFSVRPKGGPKKASGVAQWLAADGEFEVSCRPRSQHGSFCRIRPETGGKLRVRVYSKGHRTGSSGHLSEDFVAGPCQP